ncbi:MAG: hypothetical protein J5838_04000, partial [Desulfovibrio sp.]|nr:hypothetical protein [Desulfovibrio sp.]
MRQILSPKNPGDSATALQIGSGEMHPALRPQGKPTPQSFPGAFMLATGKRPSTVRGPFPVSFVSRIRP